MKNFLLAAALLAAPAAYGQAQTAAPAAAPDAPYHLLRTIPVGGEGGWDYLSVDPAGQRLYVAHGAQIEILDLRTRLRVGAVRGLEGAHGVAVVPTAGRGYISSGRNSQCVAFDLKTLAPLGSGPTGPKPDAMLYDAASGRVFAFSNQGGASTVLDAATGKVVGTAALGGDVEMGVSDGQGHVFVNIEDKNELVEFDARSLAVLHRYPLAPGDAPTGLALDAAAHRLFSGCANGKLVVTDSQSGRQVAVLPIGKGVDGVAFDASAGNIISTNGEGTLTIIHQDTPDKYTVTATIASAKGARTVALDPVSHHFYTCTADYGPAPAPTEANPRPRPAIVPGTFRVLEYGR